MLAHTNDTRELHNLEIRKTAIFGSILMFKFGLFSDHK